MPRFTSGYHLEKLPPRSAILRRGDLCQMLTLSVQRLSGGEQCYVRLLTKRTSVQQSTVRFSLGAATEASPQHPLITQSVPPPDRWRKVLMTHSNLASVHVDHDIVRVRRVRIHIGDAKPSSALRLSICRGLVLNGSL